MRGFVPHSTLYALLTLAALLVACSQAAPPTPTALPPTPLPAPTEAPARGGGLPAGMRRYIDPQGGFSVAYPEGWTPLPDQGSVRFVEDPFAINADSPAAGAMVFVLSGKLADIQAASGKAVRNSKDLLDYTLEGVKPEQHPEFGRIELFESNRLVFAASEGTYDDNVYQVRVRVYIATAVRGDRAVTVVSGAPGEEFDAYRPTFQAIVRTVALP